MFRKRRFRLFKQRLKRNSYDNWMYDNSADRDDGDLEDEILTQSIDLLKRYKLTNKLTDEQDEEFYYLMNEAVISQDYSEVNNFLGSIKNVQT